VVVFAPARSEGLGRAFHERAGAPEIGAVLLAVLVAIAIAGARSVAPPLAAFATAAIVGLWMNRRLGGLNGDVHGAALELAEVAFLALAAGGGAHAAVPSERRFLDPEGHAARAPVSRPAVAPQVDREGC